MTGDRHTRVKLTYASILPTNILLGGGSHMAKPEVDAAMYSLPTLLAALQSHMAKGMMGNPIQEK